jgi:transcriptional regulator with XRE-family HTH domain
MEDKKDKEKSKGGRPSELTLEIKDMLIRCSKLGYTDKQMAAIAGVTERTINNWKKADDEFFHALKDAKSLADDSIVNSLFKRASGYITTDLKTEVSFDDDGNEILKTVQIPRRMEPDTVAAIFWLKNRQPKEWRDKVENHNHNVNETYEEFIARTSEGKTK